MNDRELDQAVRQWERLAHKTARRYERHVYDIGLSYDDLLQEARIGILKGLQTFDPGKGPPLTVWMTIMAAQQVRRALDSATCGKNRSLNQATTTLVDRDGDEDSILDRLEGDPMDRPDYVVEQDMEADALSRALDSAVKRAGLTASEKKYLEAVFDGGSYQQIGAEFGVSAQAIQSAIAKAKQKLALVFEIESEAA